jgi:pimeloyl-ACP methyl ester carboxylesterase
MTQADHERATEILHMVEAEVLKRVDALIEEFSRSVDLVKSAVASRLWEVTSDARWKEALETLCKSEDADAAFAATIALLWHGKLDPTEEPATTPTFQIEAMGAQVRDRWTVLVHGTWASQDSGAWWKPGGNFFDYLVAQAVPGLHQLESTFSWSGDNRDGARSSAAKRFAEWLKAQKPKSLHVVGHSHGANVALLATKEGLEIENLVMLSTPIREDYVAKMDWGRLGAVRSVQAEHDAVVAIARGVKRFPAGVGHGKLKESEIKESGHSKTHDPEVWTRHDLLSFSALR